MRFISVLLILFFSGSVLLASEEPKESDNNNSSVPQSQDDSEEGFGFHMGISAGAAILDGQLYNQIGIRPEFSIGKLGIALDLSVYLDADGNIRKENWNDWNDVYEKFYYIRWGHQGDPLYIKVGAIDNYRLGFGLLMNHYENTIEYPSVIRTGLEFGLQGEQLGFQGMVNNFSEAFNGGGLMAGRLGYKLIGDFEIGISTVFDRNQYKGLKDSDHDGVPDYLDDLPHNKNYAVDTDGDGIPDELDPDRDGNGFTDNPNAPTVPDSSYLNDDNFDISKLKKRPFDINSAKNKEQLAFAADISYPFINKKYLTLIAYSQYAQFAYGNGWGVTAPGLMAKFAFINARAEYRIFDKNFIPEYFNTTYELERAVLHGDSIDTKRQLLKTVTERLQGYLIGADFNIGDFMIFGAEYQHMSKNNIMFQTLRANLDLQTDIIPKINKAGAYYYQNNTSLSKIFTRTEGTVTGLRFGYEIGGGATLLIDYRLTYRDLNGDGRIKGSKEVVKSTLVQTVFTF